eukprot:1036248-Prymnesium_polylepis.1
MKGGCARALVGSFLKTRKHGGSKSWSLEWFHSAAAPEPCRYGPPTSPSSSATSRRPKAPHCRRLPRRRASSHWQVGSTSEASFALQRLSLNRPQWGR